MASVFLLTLFFFMSILELSSMIGFPMKKLLFDFKNNDNLANWQELSDTVRDVGKSKAVFVTYNTKSKQSALLLTMLMVQENGAGFCGIRTITQLNLEKYEKLSFTCIPNGNATHYKVVLRHNNENDEPYPAFEQQFEVKLNSENNIELPLMKFKPYFRGKLVDNVTLNTSSITAFGFQVAGGVYESFKQSGLSSLELDQIWAILKSSNTIIS
ncbi:uncharacterized protein LOC126898367 [Daktulosphaira vitifoliae]|uniref:uncharacterized protein LOC126898367 n=1 Tax=Daktulosphaira vitifoliae TaxID=58002 RepID=UPI0021A9D0A4|nr:uncharacterized protein LOC126898367 [Daktulosphaira vitifoliae]XP_050528293.1 uncharacterized protein LOC126898367 [Daktulosphaira vitifoliae]